MIKSILFDQLTPVAIYSELKKLFPKEPTILFESVVNSSDGNFSFVAIGAKERLVFQDNKTIHTDTDGNARVISQDPFEFMQEQYAKIDKNHYQKLAAEAGFGYVDGYIGYTSYDMVRVFEPSLDEHMKDLEDALNVPDFDMMRPKIVLGFSHKSATLTIIDIDNDYPQMVEQIEQAIKKSREPSLLIRAELDGVGQFSMTQERFENIVLEAQEHIRSGDVFQMLPSVRYTQKGKVDPVSFYRMLRSKNPSPYLFLLEYEGFSICGSSPEVMVRLTDGEILLRPIAGTRKRGSTKQRDMELEQEMINDAKECAEHLMLIDLGRNDVGRVAKTATVKVADMMRVEKYSHVMHMVSDVIATIDDDKDMFDLFRATFTAGTMTGAPKIKAMELIAKLEGLKRSFYSGSVGYFSYTGDMDSAIAIRTSLIKPDSITLQAGAGIVADSVPHLEYLEVNNKLNALTATLKQMQEL